MKRIIVIALSIAAVAFIVANCGGGLTTSARKTLVTINGKKVTEGDVDFLGNINPRIKAQLATPAGKKRILDNLVEQEMLYQEAVKKGVKDRIFELGGKPQNSHPPYLSITPLAEIISLSKGIKSPYSLKVQDLWKKFVGIGTEIEVLVDIGAERLVEIDKDVADTISLFRQKKLEYVPGGGGEYGKLIPPHGKKQKINFYDKSQKSLKDFA